MILFKLKYASQKIIYSKYILTGNTKKNREAPYVIISVLSH